MKAPHQIALLDDKDIGIRQIRAALPEGVAAEIIWIPDLQTFRQSVTAYEILLLDYYLDRDGITSDEVFSEIRSRARLIIGFSSSTTGNAKLHQCGADFTVKKQWGDSNMDLERLFRKIFAEQIP